MSPDQVILLGDARNRILQDPSLDAGHKVLALQALQTAIEKSPHQPPMLTIEAIVKGAVGAGLGYAGASMLGSFLGAADSTITAMRVAGAGLGTMLNTGMLKSSQSDERLAFRIGFLKAARDLGVFGDPMGPAVKVAAMVPIAIPMTLDTVLSPVRAGYNMYSQGTGAIGAGAAALDAPDDSDEDITKMDLEREELNQQAARLEANRRNKIMREILARRS